MSRFVDRYGPWAVVTGASSGIGAGFARQLADRGVKVVLVARRRDRLEELAGSLPVETRVVEADLARPDAVQVINAAVAGLDVGLLVSNAGFGAKGPFLDDNVAEMVRMIDVNCRATMLLAHAFGRQLVARGRGGIIITSSTAALQGLPYSAHYAATKGYDLLLAEGLFHELRPQGVDVLALCPGATDTEGPARTGVKSDRVPAGIMDVAPVVEAALRGLGHVPVVVPGWVNRLGSLAVRVVPRKAAAAFAGKMIKRAIGQA